MACYKVTTTAITDDTLVLTIPKTSITIKNGERACFAICTDLPSSTSVVPVVFAVGTTNVPLLDMLGNTLYSDQLRTFVRIPGVWGTNPNHFKLCSCVDGRSQATATTATIPPVVAATEPTA